MAKKKMKQNYGYINEFASENYDRITIILPKGSKERVKAIATSRNQNMSDFIASLLPRSLIGKWKKKDRNENEAEGM